MMISMERGGEESGSVGIVTSIHAILFINTSTPVLGIQPLCSGSSCFAAGNNFYHVAIIPFIVREG